MAENKQKIAPYGTWHSPVSAESITAGAVGLSQIVLDGPDVYWTELRSADGGRIVLVSRAPDGTMKDLTPQGMNVRTRVHEYGGGAYTVDHGAVYISNFADQRLYRQAPEESPIPLTLPVDMRYADGAIDPLRQRIYLVREDHTAPGEAVNTLVSLDLTEEGLSAGRVEVSGSSFYSSPRISPDGSYLCWLSWDHPNMPWDGTELWVARLKEDGSLGERSLAAGGRDESIFQPQWSPDGILYFVSDRTGWWNLYRNVHGLMQAVYPQQAEFGRPMWVFGMSTYAFLSADLLVCISSNAGKDTLLLLDVRTGRAEPVEVGFSSLEGVRAQDGKIYLFAGSPYIPWSLICVDAATSQVETLSVSSKTVIPPEYVSMPQNVEFPTENGLSAYGYYYAPTNPDYAAPAGEKPPLVVMSHGGPTGFVSTVFPTKIFYFTSRGFAVLDVNYGGSAGYGREYRRRLNGQWGKMDVDDCCNGALYLVRAGLVDKDRLAITGGSAGGYTTLCALTFRNLFKVGASHFGIGDLEIFINDTHKFESHYMDTLIGPYQQSKNLYHDRSPINFVEQISCAMILFQGLEDKIVPPSQAELMYRALLKNGLPVAYLKFEGEQHGFRKAENQRRVLEAELYFYARLFGFELADRVEPVAIENL